MIDRALAEAGLRLSRARAASQAHSTAESSRMSDAPAAPQPAQPAKAGAKSGPQRAMEKLGLRRDIDLALHLPLRFDDETRVSPIADAPDGEPVQVEGTVRESHIELRGRRQLLVRIEDDSDSLLLRFLNFYPSHQKTLAVGARVRVKIGRASCRERVSLVV